MQSPIFAVALCVAALVPAVTLGAASAVLTSRWWVGRPGGAAIAGVLGVALASWAAFLVAWLTPGLLVGFDVAVLLAAVAVLIALRREALLLFRRAAPFGALALGILLLYVGLMHLWHSAAAGPFDLIADRFTAGGLPIDNRVPYLFADRLAAGGSTHELIPDWNGSDRPPLLSGFILLLRGWTDLAGLGSSSWGFAASVAGQLFWVPALGAFARSFGASRYVTALVITACALTGTSLVNTLYTWPKSLAAALVLVSAAALVIAFRRPAEIVRAVPIALLAFMLALLSHGGAAFTAPFLFVLTLLVAGRQPVRRVVAAAAVGGVAAAAVYLPWMAFQRFADPPGDRLMKWHLAGVIPIDERTFLEALVDAYGALTPQEWLAGRLVNLQTILAVNPFAGMLEGPDIRRSHEFFETTSALGLAYPVLGVILVLVLLRVLHRGPVRWNDRRFLLIAAGSAASLLFWALIMFLPGSTVVHQGSQFWLFVLIALPVLWLGPRAGAVYGVSQGLAMLAWYAPSAVPAMPSPVGIIIGVAGAGLVVLVLVGWERWGRPTARNPNRRRPS